MLFVCSSHVLSMQAVCVVNFYNQQRDVHMKPHRIRQFIEMSVFYTYARSKFHAGFTTSIVLSYMPGIGKFCAAAKLLVNIVRVKGISEFRLHPVIWRSKNSDRHFDVGREADARAVH